jgi:hypothetical protein
MKFNENSIKKPQPVPEAKPAKAKGNQAKQGKHAKQGKSKQPKKKRK